jgi:hypothetical protein
MKPFKKMTRPRKAWLITWESPRQDYMAHLKRPKVVCILDSHLHYRTIRRILPVLYCSEKRLLLSEKIVYGTCHEVQKRRMMKDHNAEILSYGENPWLFARKVDNLYVEARKFIQILRWTELPRYKVDPETLKFSEAVPSRADSHSQRYRWHADF